MRTCVSDQKLDDEVCTHMHSIAHNETQLARQLQFTKVFKDLCVVLLSSVPKVSDVTVCTCNHLVHFCI